MVAVIEGAPEGTCDGNRDGALEAEGAVEPLGCVEGDLEVLGAVELLGEVVGEEDTVGCAGIVISMASMSLSSMSLPEEGALETDG